MGVHRATALIGDAKPSKREEKVVRVETGLTGLAVRSELWKHFMEVNSLKIQMLSRGVMEFDKMQIIFKA